MTYNDDDNENFNRDWFQGMEMLRSAGLIFMSASGLIVLVCVCWMLR
jgi:hypothetical protein